MNQGRFWMGGIKEQVGNSLRDSKSAHTLFWERMGSEWGKEYRW